jgi:Polyketide cyclase / dehydrase and lipid transport/Domain of unknown function (DUF4331)
MSDHVDGPRSIGEPATDLTDLFAFTSPENPARTVLAANVFPSAGASAVFTDAANHAIVMRRVTVAGLGDAAKFQAGDREIRFNFRFDQLEAQPGDAKPIQRGTCTLPDGRTLRFVVNDERGASTPDRMFRVFAGLRSDPFLLAWLVESLKPFQNLLQHDNVLCMVVEFDTRRVLDPDQGSLFGVIAETTPIPQASGFIGHQPPRFDWVGRPEQTNMRLNNPALKGTDDLRDLWNQQTPFAIAAEFVPTFRKRLVESLENWDLRDSKADWTSPSLAASANVFLDDFMLIDVAKPTTDVSFLEIEKSTLIGRAYQTGGGRTVNANDIDILLTWMVNHDREPLHGGATGATQPGRNVFPYFAPPNTEMQTVADSVVLDAPADKVWAIVGPFGGTWHPLIAHMRLSGTGVGQLRTIETVDGKRIIERLEAMDNARRQYRYSNVSGIGASNYTGTLSVTPKGAGCTVTWRVQYLADGQPDLIVKTIVGTLLKAGFEGLKPRFASSK